MGYLFCLYLLRIDELDHPLGTVGRETAFFLGKPNGDGCDFVDRNNFEILRIRYAAVNQNGTGKFLSDEPCDRVDLTGLEDDVRIDAVIVEGIFHNTADIEFRVEHDQRNILEVLDADSFDFCQCMFLVDVELQIPLADGREDEFAVQLLSPIRKVRSSFSFSSSSWDFMLRVPRSPV